MALSDIIRDPGKFEGEPEYVRDILWPLALGGASDETLLEDDDTTDIFFLDDTLRREYDLADDAYAIAVWARSDGCVCSRELTEKSYDRIVAAIERDREDQDEE